VAQEVGDELYLCPVEVELLGVFAGEPGQRAVFVHSLEGQLDLAEAILQLRVIAFRGDHYVECYVIKDGIVVARDRLRVPISPE
jgi:hypothetical protein